METLARQNTGMISWTNDQVELIKRQIAPGTSPDEFALFLYVSKRSGLDPLSKQIYSVMRKKKDKATNRWIEAMVIQTGIDGFRVIANRSGDYAGQDEPVWEYVKDLKSGDDKLLRAKVAVYKFDPRGNRYVAAVGVAYWEEYVQQADEWVPNPKDPGKDMKSGRQVPVAMWARMPHSQLAKCAEALALRKAFPQDLSGIYTDVEMGQADRDGGTQDSTHEVVITETVEQLHDKYIKRWQDYLELVGENMAQTIHPDNWKGEGKTAKNYVYAMRSLEDRISAEVEKQKSQTKP